MQEPAPSVAPDPDSPGQFEEVIRRAMAKRPDDRYPSAGDLGRAAVAAAEGKDVSTGERNVAPAPAAPSGVTAVPLPPPTPGTIVEQPQPQPVSQPSFTPPPQAPAPQK